MLQTDFFPFSIESLDGFSIFLSFQAGDTRFLQDSDEICNCHTVLHIYLHRHFLKHRQRSRLRDTIWLWAVCCLYFSSDGSGC